MEDLLEFASIESAEAKVVEVALVDVVGQVLDDLAPEIQAASAQIELGELPELLAHPRYLRHILRNLISNVSRL